MLHLIKLVIVLALLSGLVVITADVFPALGHQLEATAQGTMVQKPAQFVANFLIHTGEQAGEWKEKGLQTLEKAGLEPR